MDKTGVKLIIFFAEVIVSKRQLRGRLGDVVQIHVVTFGVIF